jgi:hypothetical protein
MQTVGSAIAGQGPVSILLSSVSPDLELERVKRVSNGRTTVAAAPRSVAGYCEIDTKNSITNFAIFLQYCSVRTD